MDGALSATRQKKAEAFVKRETPRVADKTFQRRSIGTPLGDVRYSPVASGIVRRLIAQARIVGFHLRSPVGRFVRAITNF